MKIFITGITGMLGYDLYWVLSVEHEVYGCSRAYKNVIPMKSWCQLDLTNGSETYKTISKYNPDVVIHCAAYTDVDGCERNPDMAYMINSLATRNVAVACQRFDTVMVYISTDYVFDGRNAGPEGYCEFDEPNPINIYGRSKLLGEFYTRHLLNKFFIIRSSWLFGVKRESFVSKVIKKLKNSEQIIVAEQIGTLTYTFELAEKINEIIKTFAYGVYHIANVGMVSRLDIVKGIAEILNIEPRVVVKKIDEVFTVAKRPKNSALCCYQLKLENMKQMSRWQDAVKKFLKEKQHEL